MNLTSDTGPNGASPWFLTDRDAAHLLDAERALRYRWAAQLAAGRSALDVGCGDGHGARQLAAAGAREVVGIDAAETALDRAGLPSALRLDAGDITRLPYADDSFELITCFGVLEHAGDAPAIVDELVRVCATGGVLALSWQGEATALRDLLGPRLPQLRIVSQRDLMVSAAGSDPSSPTLTVYEAGETGTVVRSLALAGEDPLPEAPPLAIAASAFEPHTWQAAFTAIAETLRAAEVRAAELERQLDTHGELTNKLIDSEQRSAAIPTLRLQIADLEYELGTMREREAAGRDEVEELQHRLNRAQQTLVSVMTSPSWKLTQPLRRAKKLLQG